MGKKQNGGPMLFVKNGGKLSAPSDRPGGPLISYYAKKGGKIPQANFTNYSGTQMYGTGGNFDYNLPSMKYSQTPSGRAYKNGGTIHINPANKGKFNATKARTGKSTEELTHSSNPVTKKRAVFAQNAAKWKHANGGPILEESPYITDKGINLNLPVNRQQEVKPLKFNGFLANDRKENLIVGGINPRYQTKDFSVGPYVVGVGNKHFQKFPADMGMSGTYHVNDRLDIDMQGNSKNVNAGLRYKFYNGGPLLVGNQHVAMGGSLKMYDQGGALNVAYGKGGMIKRADGSYSQRGLWDNIRANAGSGKEPTKEMLQQERKITSKYKNGGMINPYAMNIVSKGLKKYLLGGSADETDGVISSNKVPFSSWSTNQSIEALNPGKITIPNEKPTLRNEYVKPTGVDDFTKKVMSEEAQDTFKNEKQAAALYSGAIQTGSSFIGNFAEANRRKSEGAHDTGFGSDVKGAAKGMGTGASIGSTFGPIGTAVGAAVGGVAGYIGGRASGKVKKKAYDAWQADYMKAEQSLINSNAASRYQDFKPTSSGYYAKGGSLLKMYRPGGQLPPIYVTDPNDARLRSYQDSLNLYNFTKFQRQLEPSGVIKKMTNGYTEAERVKHKKLASFAETMVDNSRDIDWDLGRYAGAKYPNTNPINRLVYGDSFQPSSPDIIHKTIKPKGTWLGDGMNYDYSNTNPVQPVELAMKPSTSNPPKAGTPGMMRSISKLPIPKKTSPRMQSLQPRYMQSSPVSMQGQPMQIQPMTLPQQKGKPVYGPGNTIIGYNGEDGKMRKAYQYTGAPNNELNLQDKALLEDKDKWQQYLSSKDSGYKFATGGSMASNYMANQKAVGGNLVPLSSDAVEVKGPSHANGGVKLPEMEAEVEGKEVIKDDYVFSEQLGFAKEAKKLAKAKGRIEEKPSTPERINSLKLLESKENQLKLAQEFIRKQNNLQ